MERNQIQIWDLWFPKAAATGLPFARCRIQPVETLLVHAAPPFLTVTVRDAGGQQIAVGVDLEATADTPMARLTLDASKVFREDIWPGSEDIGNVVVLPGGEAGVLKQWWHAEDHSEWRWQIELYNHK
ncbi:MAG: hypothetical protein EHM70_21935 [Chloroflexota bacterium]|nr:MAG: hypothetical protein EHM70_21935 [Chloroflexota bacterium]